MIKVKNHPAQARDENRRPLFDDDGNPVPLFPDSASVYVDGKLVAYVSASNAVTFIKHGLGIIKDEILDAVAKRNGPVTSSFEIAAPDPRLFKDDD